MKGKLASGKAKSKIENCCPPAPAPGAREAKAKGPVQGLSSKINPRLWEVEVGAGYARHM